MQWQEGLWIQGVNVIVPQRRVFRVYASKLASDESLGHQHMGAVYHQGSSQIASTSESHGGDLIILRYDRSSWRVGLLQCSHSLKGARQVRGQSRLIYPKSKASVRKEVDSEEHHSAAEVDLPIAKGCRCKATDSRAMGLAAPWYRRGGTSVESSIPCSHGGRALVVKEAKEVENAKANFKYQDRAKGQRPRNFIRPVSMGFSSR
ncbi:hypothetical protein BHE74_00047416 [Ensete ventricosum]|nr:hypothetical protein BHE74_00047416 [Ensete ventricosum]